MRYYMIKKKLILGIVLLFIASIVTPTVIGYNILIKEETTIVNSHPTSNTFYIHGGVQKPPKPIVHGKILLAPQTSGMFCALVNDSNINTLQVKFDWGDGNESNWCQVYGNSYIILHRWNTEGEFFVNAKIRDINNVESEWSDELKVVIKKGIKGYEHLGGLGYTTIFHNHYSFDIYNLTWNITCRKVYVKDFGFIFSGMYTNGLVGHIPSLGQAQLKSQGLFGFGYLSASFSFIFQVPDTHGYYTKLHTWNPVIVLGPFVIKLLD